MATMELHVQELVVHIVQEPKAVTRSMENALMVARRATMVHAVTVHVKVIVLTVLVTLLEVVLTVSYTLLDPTVVSLVVNLFF